MDNILKICNSGYYGFNYLRLCVCLLVIDNCRTTVPKTTDRPEFKIKTKTNHFDRLPKTYRPYFKGTATEPTLFTNPSVFFIFPLYFFLIQFSSRPQMAHLLLPQTHKPTQRAITKEPFLPTTNNNDVLYHNSQVNPDSISIKHNYFHSIRQTSVNVSYHCGQESPDL